MALLRQYTASYRLTGSEVRSRRLLPQPQDLAYHIGTGRVRAGTRTRGPIAHPGDAFSSVAVGPLLRGPWGRPSTSSRHGARPAIHDQLCESQAGNQGRVSVGHEGLLVSEAVSRQLHFTTGGPSPVSPTHRREPGQGMGGPLAGGGAVARPRASFTRFVGCR